MLEGIITHPVDLYPDYTIYACLFTNISNAGELRKKLVKGEMKCALLSTTFIPDIFPVLLACNKAVHCYMNSSMKTRNMHTEILFNLSPTNSINESLKKFGLKDDDTTLLCVSVRNDALDGMFDEIQGDVKLVSDLHTVSNLTEIRKLFQITDQELEIGTLSDAVSLRVATKDAL